MRILLILCLLYYIALGEEEVEVDDHKHHGPRERNIVVRVGRRDVFIEAKFKNTTYEDEYQFEARTGDSLISFHFEYELKVRVNRKVNKTKMDLDFVAERVLEYDVADSDFFAGSNEIVSSYPEWKRRPTPPKWGPWQDNSYSVNGTKVYKFSASTGIFTIRFQLSAQPVKGRGGLQVDPNSIKIDFEVDNYPYIGDPNATRLALDTTIRSKVISKMSGRRAIVDRSLKFLDSPESPLGSFTWNGTAAVGDTAIDVAAWTPEQGKQREFDVFFSFMTPSNKMHPASIIWDPTIGLDYDDESGDEFCMGSVCGAGAITVVVSVIVVVLGAMVGATVLIFKRRAGYEAVE